MGEIVRDEYGETRSVKQGEKGMMPSVGIWTGCVFFIGVLTSANTDKCVITNATNLLFYFFEN